MATRVIGGRFRGRRLIVPKSDRLRPTLGRVRENLFNILGDAVREAVFLDLYAGLGAVGIEALSRGARRCVFVENHPPCVRAIQDNLELVGAADCAEVVRASARAALETLARREARFDVLFADPPYRGDLGERALTAIAESGLWRDAEATVIIQVARETELPAAAAPLALARRVNYGATSLWFYKPGEPDAMHPRL